MKNDSTHALALAIVEVKSLILGCRVKVGSKIGPRLLRETDQLEPEMIKKGMRVIKAELAGVLDLAILLILLCSDTKIVDAAKPIRFGVER